MLREGRPPARRPLTVTRVTRWARAGRVTLHIEDGDVELRLLAPDEYAAVSLGDLRDGRGWPAPCARRAPAALSGRRDAAQRTLVARVLRVFPDAQVGNG